MKPAVGHAKWLVAALAIRRSHWQRYARPRHATTKSWSDRELRPHQAKLADGMGFDLRLCRLGHQGVMHVPETSQADGSVLFQLDADGQIKHRDRVRDLAEVYTHQREVTAMGSAAGTGDTVSHAA